MSATDTNDSVVDSDKVFFNPLEPGYVEWPYPHLAELREHDPVHLSLTGQWILFAHSDVFALLRDPGMSVSDSNIEVIDEKYSALIREAGGDLEPSTSMLGADPPDHTRLRRLVSKAFTPSAIDALRPRIQELVDDILDAVEARGSADIAAELAFPLPFDVISEMLGMPEADKDLIAEWSAALVKTIDPIVTDDEIRAAIHAGQMMDDHVDNVVEWKRANPADDLLTALIEAEEDGDRLSSAELRDQISLLFVAGHETTVNLIGTGIYELLRNPEQLGIWRDDPSLDANAVDELLRYISPVQFSRRITMQEAVFGGRTIDKGSVVLAGLASANRDAAKWGINADQLDLRREGPGQHLSFGSGVHYCLGASLARMEAQVAIGSFIRRFPNARVVGKPGWNGRINLRGLERLDISTT